MTYQHSFPAFEGGEREREISIRKIQPDFPTKTRILI